MKKIIAITIITIIGLTFAYSQPRSVGVNVGSGTNISYQHNLGSSNMLDVAIGLSIFPMGFGGHLTYDWIDPFNASIPWKHKGEWHWLMGIGIAGGIYNFRAPSWHAGMATHIGIEYDFWVPFQVSLDWRPSFGASNYKRHIDFDYGGLYNISLGLRYKF